MLRFDELDFEQLVGFTRQIIQRVGCRHRACAQGGAGGLSPHDNRTVPPLPTMWCSDCGHSSWARQWC
jgi:hypothetical protein